MFICGKESPKRKSVYKDRTAKARSLEEQILKLSGLEFHRELQVIDVPIIFQGNTYTIHTIKTTSKSSESLVLLHGYGGSSTLYLSMLKDLSKRYNVYCIDFLGMGLSSRPNFTCTSTQETIHYFVETVDLWREAVGLTEFTLGGHSFGGYMATQYAIKYQRRIKQLFLFSPAGVTKHEKEFSVAEYTSTLPWSKRKVHTMTIKFWENKISPAEYFRRHPIFAGLLLKNYFHGQFKNDNKDHKGKLFYKFYSNVLKMEGGSDQALFYILQPPKATAEVPLENLIIDELCIPVICYYGDKDWMDQKGSHRIVATGTKDFKVKIIENSGHQLIVQNPKQITQHMFEESIIEKSSEMTNDISQ